MKQVKTKDLVVGKSYYLQDKENHAVFKGLDSAGDLKFKNTGGANEWPQIDDGDIYFFYHTGATFYERNKLSVCKRIAKAFNVLIGKED